MSRSRVSRINEINEMIEKMSVEFEEAKIKVDSLSLPEEAILFPIGMVSDGYKWLKAIYNNEFAAVQTVRSLLTDTQWARYKLWESFNRTQEMKLLREKQVPFRKAVISRDRPVLFKKGTQNGQIKNINSSKGTKPRSTEASTGEEERSGTA